MLMILVLFLMVVEISFVVIGGNEFIGKELWDGNGGNFVYFIFVLLILIVFVVLLL